MLLAILVSGAILAACHSQKNAQPGAVNNKTITADTSHPLTGKKWFLKELYGKPVADTTASGEKKPIYLEFQPNLVRMNGFGGCNGFGGNYELKGGNRITFSKVISTMMACERLETENQLFKIFETADSYALVDNTLQLNRAKMAPLAIFEAE